MAKKKVIDISDSELDIYIRNKTGLSQSSAIAYRSMIKKSFPDTSVSEIGKMLVDMVDRTKKRNQQLIDNPTPAPEYKYVRKVNKGKKEKYMIRLMYVHAIAIKRYKDNPNPVTEKRLKQIKVRFLSLVKHGK